MIVRIVLHIFDGDHLLFQGPPEQCPPIPRSGDEIVHNQQAVRVQGTSYQYQSDHVEIGLLA